MADRTSGWSEIIHSLVMVKGIEPFNQSIHLCISVSRAVQYQLYIRLYEI